MSKFLNNREKKIELMKDLLIKMDKDLISPDKIKKEFKEILYDITPADVAIIENVLIAKEGFPAEKIHKLCNTHIEIFRESLEKEEIIAEKGHPIYLLMAEHNKISELLGELHKIGSGLKEISEKESIVNKLQELKTVYNSLKDIENHMLREENVLFPFLEKHEVIQPPKILWTEHDSLRARIEDLNKILGQSTEEFNTFKENLSSLILYIVDLKSSHIYKENKILFPAAMEKLRRQEWQEVNNSMNDIGYASFTPGELVELMMKRSSKIMTSENIQETNIVFDSGKLLLKEIKGIFDTMPFEITFVDKDDRVKYFNKGDKRIFVRTKSVIGRGVQNCHPPKSIHIVEKIINDFKSNKRNVAEFWINIDNKLIYIRYFAVKDKENNYLGTLEVTQDITDIKKLQEEKRIYSEE
jgi:hypothetical protein